MALRWGVRTEQWYFMGSRRQLFCGSQTKEGLRNSSFLAVLPTLALFGEAGEVHFPYSRGNAVPYEHKKVRGKQVTQDL